MKAKIVKIISNQYTIVDKDNNRYEAVAMGKLRLGDSPVVGDNVIFEFRDSKATIEKILPRKNHLIRPLIANVDQALIVMSAKNPEFSSALVDRLIFLVVNVNIEPLICITKMDLSDDSIYDYINDYRKSGYTVILVDKDNVDHELDEILKDKITVLTGQSGVGKSTLLNKLNPEFNLKTQEISKALGRGKHTTRHSELHEVCGGLVGDTPGFSSLDFSHMDVYDLRNSVLDFRKYINACRFNDCLHQNEPGCKVKEAVDNGEVSSIRYNNYLDVLKSIQERRVKY
ncbi:MAG TPA: ribosome small subunit-dependent GTPase A [Erysipelotrichaceae bacterium]|jgi:ribosome biogenesis GTPase|nr:ribosome small subunit-dependent GTPase A [Bacillota bacterium]NLP22724.1 ribosome small subunit-dependent GTPase A [Erysipelotrichaceae bacterium]HCY06197.1 ribosome small subunit-dependent GTPase A [Erysipelotrichaceae bacterium]